jgi:hypothetical protein
MFEYHLQVRRSGAHTSKSHGSRRYVLFTVRPPIIPKNCLGALCDGTNFDLSHIVSGITSKQLAVETQRGLNTWWSYGMRRSHCKAGHLLMTVAH